MGYNSTPCPPPPQTGEDQALFVIERYYFLTRLKVYPPHAPVGWPCISNSIIASSIVSCLSQSYTTNVMCHSVAAIAIGKGGPGRIQEFSVGST
jgi:hypothetical protein